MKTSKKIPVKRFVRIEEKSKSKYRDVFYGVVRTSSKIEGVKSSEMITAYVVKSGSDSPWIYLDEFNPDEFIITDASKEDVQHFFKKSVIHADKEFDSAEFDLRDKKRNITTAKERYSEVFGDMK